MIQTHIMVYGLVGILHHHLDLSLLRQVIKKLKTIKKINELFDKITGSSGRRNTGKLKTNLANSIKNLLEIDLNKKLF